RDPPPAARHPPRPPPAPRHPPLGSVSAKREEPAPAPRHTETSRPLGGLGTVAPREEPVQAPAEPAPAVNETPLQSAPPVVPPARPYADSQAEELDVPDFLK
ncbi:hypothetical protein ACFV0D_36130, partial [Streptomyces sp. NPDC059556]